jgi:hypothetical protein
MPTPIFSNKIIEYPYNLSKEKSIKLNQASFTKGFDSAEGLTLKIEFLGFPQEGLTLNFSNKLVLHKPLLQRIFFNGDGGLIIPIPENCKKIYFKINKDYKPEIEFTLSFDFYPEAKFSPIF